MSLLDFVKKLRSKKNVMIDGERETAPMPKSQPMFINADGEQSKKPMQKMAEIQRQFKPEKVVERELKK